jgi:GNAT superfamily N-acetyltransferase
MKPMLFSDLALARRLERAEGRACVSFAEAQREVLPESGAEWIECAGALAVFNGVDSPVTQSFGLGLFEELNAASLDQMVRFFFDRGTAAVHEVSPLAGVAAMDLLCARKYRPIEISSVLYRSVEQPLDEAPASIRTRVIGQQERDRWADVSARGWSSEYPEMLDTIRGFGAIAAARRDSPCFLAEIDGEPGAAGVLGIHDGVALFGGSATAPELRRRGLQSALLHERMRYALEHGCDLAMMVAAVGSESQRNAERKGFRIAYTRTKWQLDLRA